MEGKIYHAKSKRLLGIKGIKCTECTNDKVFKKGNYYECTKCKTRMLIPKEITEDVKND